MTSCVTHRLNALASGLRERRMREYRPGSDTTSICCSPPGVRILFVPFSSSSKREMVLLTSVSSRHSHTSLATNHGWPSRSTTRTFPNSAFSKICISDIHKLSVRWLMCPRRQYVTEENHISDRDTGYRERVNAAGEEKTRRCWYESLRLPKKERLHSGA